MIELVEAFWGGECRLLTLKEGKILFVDGEQVKDLDTLFNCFNWMINNRPVCTNAL